MISLRNHISLAVLVSLFLVAAMYMTAAHILHNNISWQFIVFMGIVTAIHVFWMRFWEYRSLLMAYVGVYTLVGGMLSVTLLHDIIVASADGSSLLRFTFTFMVMGVIGLFIVLFDKKIIAIQCFLMAMVTVNTWQYIKKVYWDATDIEQTMQTHYDNLTVKHQFIHKPNIYYLVPDTYPSFDKLAQMDTFKNREMYDFLKNNQFYIQDEAFSNWPSTNTSMGTTFNMKSPQLSDYKSVMHMGNIMAYSFIQGKNIVIKTFEKNGYDIYLRYSGTSIAERKEKRLHNNYDAFRVLIEMSQLEPLWKKVYDLLGLKKEISPPHFYTALQKIPNDKTPKFIYSHSNFIHKDIKECFNTINKDFDNIQTYYEQIECTNNDIKLTVEFLQKTDPNAIIIFQADHGKSVFDNSLYLLDEKEVISEFGILFAVKWPNQCAYLGREKYTPVNLFPRVFACLSGKKPDYQSLQPDATYRILGVPPKQYKVIENFKYIKNTP